MGFADTVQDYWDSQNINAETASNTILPLNLLSMNSLFATGVNSTLVDVDSMARFLYTFVKKTRSFKIYLGPYTKKDDGTVVYTTYPSDTEPAWIGWQSFRVSIGGTFRNEGYMLGYLGDVGGSYYTPASPLLWTQLSAKLKQNYTFSIIVSNVPNGSLIVDNAEEAKGILQKSYLVCTISPRNSDSLVNG